MRAGFEPAIWGFVDPYSYPTELPHREVESYGIEPHSQDFQSCAYTKSAKIPFFVMRAGFEPAI